MSQINAKSLNELRKRDVSQIKAFVTDVDGVLTDGTLFMLSPGQWRRKFNIQDGLGLKALIEKGIKIAFITGSRSDDIVERASMLGIETVYLGVEDKLPALKDFLDKNNLKASEVVYVGDDMPDLPVLNVVGFPITVPNANDILLMNPNFYVTSATGGNGAVREVIDLLMNSKGV